MRSGPNNSNWKGGIAKDKKAYKKQYQKKHREELLKTLGDKCTRCGFTDFRALQVDHVKGGGTKERLNKKIYHTDVIKSFLNHEGKYQLLCANCNWIKKFDNNETRGYCSDF